MIEIYKVVSKHGDKFRSYNYDRLAITGLVIIDKISLEYTLGQITRAEFGYLFAFDTLERARNFSRNRPILRCFADKIYQPKVNYLYDSGSKSKLIDFWKLYKLGENIDGNFSFPLGTVLCRELVPVEIMDSSVR